MNFGTVQWINSSILNEYIGIINLYVLNLSVSTEFILFQQIVRPSTKTSAKMKKGSTFGKYWNCKN